MDKTISERAAAGAVALQAFAQANSTPISILTAYVEHKAPDVEPDALTINLEGTVGDLLSDVMHTLCAEQYPGCAEAGQQIPVSSLVLSRFHLLDELLSDFVTEAFGSAPDYLFRAMNNYQVEQEAAATLLRRGA
jgi:hypothetical protein